MKKVTNNRLLIPKGIGEGLISYVEQVAVLPLGWTTGLIQFGLTVICHKTFLSREI